MNKHSTTNGLPPAPGLENASAPQPIDPSSGQHGAYWVLFAEERAQGFVRPVRGSYRHVGTAGPAHPTRDLTPEESARYEKFGYAKLEMYPESELPKTGRFWTQRDLDSVGRGCGAVTSMGRSIAETYARKPSYYGRTFCARCRAHLPVGAAGEFVWDDGSRVGT